jgi:hypothetical protein
VVIWAMRYTSLCTFTYCSSNILPLIQRVQYLLTSLSTSSPRIRYCGHGLPFPMPSPLDDVCHSLSFHSFWQGHRAPYPRPNSLYSGCSQVVIGINGEEIISVDSLGTETATDAMRRTQIFGPSLRAIIFVNAV